MMISFWELQFAKGPKNSITDVPGVKAGHLTVHQDVLTKSGKMAAIRTGLTAVLPYDMKKEKRLFFGNFILRTRNDVTGYEVTDDFCYLNSPIVISNKYSIGRVYNAILSYGFSLGREEVWPPVVIGMDDSLLNDMGHYEFEEHQILELFERAQENRLEEGSAGIGLGLASLGWKSGVGASSRKVFLGEKKFTAGVLVASNLGAVRPFFEDKKKESQFSNPHGSLVLIMATDIPLIPHQIRIVLSGVVTNIFSALKIDTHRDSVTAVLFLTANPMDMKNGGPREFEFSCVREIFLTQITEAVTEASREALLRSFLKAGPVKGKSGRTVDKIPEEELNKIFRR